MTHLHPLDAYLTRLGYNLSVYTPNELSHIRSVAWAVEPDTLAAVSEIDNHHPNDPEVPLRYLEGASDYTKACFGWLREDGTGPFYHLCQPKSVNINATTVARLIACVEWWNIRTDGWQLHRTVYPNSGIVVDTSDRNRNHC